ncbi:hypothetical protein AVEN_56277-1 [Araneus ventricosus]|uniref:Uncharacterized protein n=1 Tax=Araneus ventricosus TaxID=182803 RepID=A0A4Y2FYD5_ARAVE|nr:hypothetical protein AVEN_56277-1 [Araneus ventricosus]
MVLLLYAARIYFISQLANREKADVDCKYGLCASYRLYGDFNMELFMQQNQHSPMALLVIDSGTFNKPNNTYYLPAETIILLLIQLLPIFIEEAEIAVI